MGSIFESIIALLFVYLRAYYCVPRFRNYLFRVRIFENKRAFLAYILWWQPCGMVYWLQNSVFYSLAVKFTFSRVSTVRFGALILPILGFEFFVKF